MPSEFMLSVVAPDRLVLEEQVQSAILPGSQGYFGVMRGHESLISALQNGYIEFRDKSGERHFVAITGGFAEVSPERTSVLADFAERRSEIDVATAEADLERARQMLRGEMSDTTREQAIEEIERAAIRLRVAKMQ